MEDSMAHPYAAARSLDLPGWKNAASHVAAFIIAILFLSSGIWKIIEPFTWRTMVEQLKAPYALSLPLTLALGIGETFAGVLVLMPRFRRWGASLAALLLIIFMIYMGVNYSTLAGKDCSCFPWVKRSVSPEFFIGDAIMLGLALIAGWWSRPAWGVRSAAVVLGAVAVFSGVSFGVNAARQSGTKAPDTITVDGQPYSLRHGNIFLYFYDPLCSHCDAAARKMSKLNWGDTKVVAIPTNDPQFAASFLHDTHLKAMTSLDVQQLRKIFPFRDPPFGVALHNGREKAPVTRFEGNEPDETLKRIGFVQ
jgi:uncharacterized membrane protein YphA (DoxX/SURF4 family)